MRRFSAVLVFLALGLMPGNAEAFASPARAQIAIDAGSILNARDVVEVTISNIPDDVEEFELLLIANRAKYRLTPQLFGRRATIRWTVPPIDTTHAVLLVRGGSHDKGERDLVRSRPFELVDRQSAPLQYVVRQGEAWIETSNALPTPDHRSLRSGFAPTAEASADDQRGRYVNSVSFNSASLAPAAAVNRSTFNSRLSRSPRVVPQRK